MHARIRNKPVMWNADSTEDLERTWANLVANAPWLGTETLASKTMGELKGVYERCGWKSTISLRAVELLT